MTPAIRKAAKASADENSTLYSLRHQAANETSQQRKNEALKRLNVIESFREANTTGENNTAVGMGSLESNTTANHNTAVGKDSLQSNTTGANNVAVGKGSLTANTTGTQLVSVGTNSLIVFCY